MQLGADLPNNTTQYWRARAMDAETLGDWSAVQVFRTPNVTHDAPPVARALAGSKPRRRRKLRVEQRTGNRRLHLGEVPDRLAAGVSSNQRVANMEFLRDRIIEAGKCGGLNLGWNLKRGGPERSVDFLAWHRGDGDMGVDIGFDYDNTSTPLRLPVGRGGAGCVVRAVSGGVLLGGVTARGSGLGLGTPRVGSGIGTGTGTGITIGEMPDPGGLRLYHRSSNITVSPGTPGNRRVDSVRDTPPLPGASALKWLHWVVTK